MILAQAAIVALSLAIAIWLRPWRQKNVHALATPLLATLVILPWLWALPALKVTPLQLQWSGACLVLLMLGWPLAVPALCLAGVATGLIAGLGWQQQLDLVTWLGIVPATIALGVGAAVRRLLGTHPFMYILGRGFLGSVVSLFIAGALRQWAGAELSSVDAGLSLVGRWLMAWGDAFVTGMLCAIFVAYRPEWLATWSDHLYLRR
jgi:uncharacterized membrane protein